MAVLDTVRKAIADGDVMETEVTAPVTPTGALQQAIRRVLR
jgi:hypothetical protein